MNIFQTLKSSKHVHIAVIVLFAVIAGGLMVKIFAGGIHVNVETEDTSVSTNATIRSSSEASGDSYVEFGNSDPPGTCDYPDLVALDYSGGSSDNTMQRFTYNPTTGNTGSAQEVIFNTSAGFSSQHGFSVFNGIAYVSQWTGSAFEMIGYDVDAESAGFGTSSVLAGTYGIGSTVDPSGQIYLIGPGAAEITKVTISSGATSTLIGSSNDGADFSQFGIQYGPDGRLYVMTQNGNLEVFNAATGAFIETFVTNIGAGRYAQRDLAFDAAGDLYISNADITKYHGPASAQAGQLISTMTIDNGWPHGITFHPTTGELFAGMFHDTLGVSVFDYAAGSQSPKYSLSFPFAKDIQFVGCSS